MPHTDNEAGFETACANRLKSGVYDVGAFTQATIEPGTAQALLNWKGSMYLFFLREGKAVAPQKE